MHPINLRIQINNGVMEEVKVIPISFMRQSLHKVPRFDTVPCDVKSIQRSYYKIHCFSDSL